VAVLEGNVVEAAGEGVGCVAAVARQACKGHVALVDGELFVGTGRGDAAVVPVRRTHKQQVAELERIAVVEHACETAVGGRIASAGRKFVVDLSAQEHAHFYAVDALVGFGQHAGVRLACGGDYGHVGNGSGVDVLQRHFAGEFRLIMCGVLVEKQKPPGRCGAERGRHGGSGASALEVEA
jgi:hypothetical protein